MDNEVAILRSYTVLSKLKARISGTWGGIDKGFTLEQIEEAMSHLKPTVKKMEEKKCII